MKIELAKKIHDEYPKVWEKLREKYHNTKLSNGVDIDIRNTDIEFVYYYGGGKIRLDTIPFFLLYALLEDFFEENGIYFNIYRLYDVNDKFVGYDFDIEGLPVSQRSLSKIFKIKNEAKEQAILKSCEIYVQCN